LRLLLLLLLLRLGWLLREEGRTADAGKKECREDEPG
jgi:hypothetical protein